MLEAPELFPVHPGALELPGWSWVYQGLILVGLLSLVFLPQPLGVMPLGCQTVALLSYHEVSCVAAPSQHLSHQHRGSQLVYPGPVSPQRLMEMQHPLSLLGLILTLSP